jgi:6-phosphofructokinase 1
MDTSQDTPRVSAEDLIIKTLGKCTIDSPLLANAAGGVTFIEDTERILYDQELQAIKEYKDKFDALPSLERAGPRKKIYFDPAKTRCGIVTCGGLCPGLNDVIRGIVMQLWYRYGIERIYGFRYGYQGFIPSYKHPVMDLNPGVVETIHEDGGTVLASSRGEQDISEIVDCLERMSINILFVIGGDGSMRGALAISEEVNKRGDKISVVGVPKTIDNDILFIDESFGFQTAYSKAVDAILSAHTEAKGAPNGIGLVKLMGRHSGFIACHTALATSDCNFVLIPEVPFKLNGENGLLRQLENRLAARDHALILVAEGAGQEQLKVDLDPHAPDTDASGNIKLKDIGVFLKDKIKAHFKEINTEINLKYIDPSYIIRSVPANPADSLYCYRLAQYAVHGAMAGKTEMVIGKWQNRMVHLPMSTTIGGRKQVDPNGPLWLSVMEATGQPNIFE